MQQNGIIKTTADSREWAFHGVPDVPVERYRQRCAERDAVPVVTARTEYGFQGVPDAPIERHHPLPLNEESVVSEQQAHVPEAAATPKSSPALFSDAVLPAGLTALLKPAPKPPLPVAPEAPAIEDGAPAPAPAPGPRAEPVATPQVRDAPAARAEIKPEAKPAPAAKAAAPKPTLWKRVLRYAALAVAIWFGVVCGLVVIYRFVNPPLSTFMLSDYLSGTSVVRKWVPLERVSPNVVRAVISSEDWRFCAHPGVDFKEIEHAIETAGDGLPRGASTISMQVTKNLFLSSSRSYFRKAIELPLTFLIELLWPKSRIFEVYLNIAEWGPGVYGVEAASQYHFGKSAAKLTDGEAALLAVALPNPALRDAGDPGPMTRKLAGAIQNRMRNLGSAADCILKRDL